ncbi:MAG: protein-L-isoaspartate O-methyltransferase [bacterium]|nr:protein-L-isoaspartate O-methyltransferase [bacterium]
MSYLVENLIHQTWLKTDNIIQAFKKIKRADFLPEESKNLAELNEALPIGFGQSISQPSVVAFMLELLQPKPGEKILDIGYGSGWTTALIAESIKPNGIVVAIERIKELKEFGEKNISKYNFGQVVKTVLGDGTKGYISEAPFDKILASAFAEKIPEEWKKQLKIGGLIVAPVKNSIVLIRKNKENEFEEMEYPGFVFVPLIEENL